MNYHNVILDLFRPFLTSKETLQSFASRTSSPSDLFWASVRQLRHLVLYHPLVHRSSVYSIFWHTSLLYVANSSLLKPEDPESQFFFLLCIAGYINLRSSFAIVDLIARGLLSLAADKGAVSHALARGIRERLDTSKMPYLSIMEGSFMLDLDLALKDPACAGAAMIAQKLDSIILDDVS